MRFYAGSDHAGFELRIKLVEHLLQRGHEVSDLGPPDAARTDYPEYATRVARAVREEAGSRGLLVCGSGLGMCMVANKINGIRAADAWNVESSRLSRAHNDANVLCIGGRLIGGAEAVAILDAWVDTPFEGGRHAERVHMMDAIEEEESRRWKRATTIGTG